MQTETNTIDIATRILSELIALHGNDYGGRKLIENYIKAFHYFLRTTFDRKYWVPIEEFCQQLQRQTHVEHIARLAKQDRKSVV